MFILRGARIGFGVVPVLGDLAADDIAIIGVTKAECLVFNGRGGGAVFYRRSRLRDLCSLLAAGGFWSVRCELWMLRWRRCFFGRNFGGWLGIALDEDVGGLGCSCGVLFGWRRGGLRYVFRRKD